MRTSYAVTFMLVLILGGTYWFTQVQAKCNLPISYRIGEFDERFDITHDEARIALVEAEAVWENATGKNLFRYDEDATFTVNFIFDDRQALTEAEKNLREQLDTSQNINSEIDETYAELVSRYSDLNMHYKDRIETYQRKLNVYNQEVASYNQEGGAPKEVYEELNARKEALDQEQVAINSITERLNSLVREINRLSEEGNQMIDFHNRQVETYNNTFGESREFAQGDYQKDTINIYTFNDTNELVLVLAHELGHAISLGHVENEESIMHYFMGAQKETLTPTEADLAEFNRLCGEEDSLYRSYQNLKVGLSNFAEYLSGFLIGK
ncbi:MAG: matrixin family metalloprotease, partial [Candidatus Paceibacterota bacterium]